MREPIATAAPALTAGNVASVIVAPSTAATMFGITNAQIVQSFNGLPPLQADCAPAAAIVRAASRASSIGGAGRPSLKSSAAGSSGTSSPVTSVKRNSSSSSFSSGGDRRSVFYTDPEQSSTTEAAEKYDTMTNDDSCSTSDACTGATDTTDAGAAKRTKQPQQDDVAHLRRADNGQVRRKQRPSSTGLDGVIGPRTHLKLVSQELEWERKFRDDQLSRILKALIAFETRLKNEQSRIKQQLYEKDDVINRQNCAIKRMKRKLAAEDESTTVEEEGGEDASVAEMSVALPATIDEVAQYCPKCRKNYYRLECRTSGTQTFEYCRDADGAESVNTENLSLNSVEYASSSEEQESSLYVRANSFKDARRSRKYTSKRSYQGYQRGTASRASSFKSNASGPATGTLAKLVERNARSRLSCPREEEPGCEAYVNIEPNANVPKIVIYENYESDKENKRMGDQNRQECDNNYDNVEPYSNRIDTLHGIHGRTGGRYNGKVLQEEQRSEEKRAGEYRLVGSSQRGDGSEQMELDDGTIFYEANASAGSVSNQQKYTEGMEMKQTIETNDDWYASASDMEDSDTALGKPYSNAAVNPVLECVNQILLQQSMDGFGDSNKDTNGEAPGEEEHYIKAQQTTPPPAKEHTAVRSKRVHFSTQNSMVQVPRISLQQTAGSSSNSSHGSANHRTKDDKVSPTYEIQSIYSNEYEPIGSEQNSYSNYYVDMESKLGSEDREREQALAEKRKTPPALPPKPANLLKLQQLSKGNQQQQQQQQRQLVSTPVKGRTGSSAQSDIAESEPDYCSISEIQDSVKCVQIVAEIHKDACEDDYSLVDGEARDGEKKEQTEAIASQQRGELSVEEQKSCTELEESFADVPKLPNVAEIVPPKKEPLNKFISQDNYITKSSGSGSSASSSPAKTGGVATTPSKKDGEFREQLSEIIAEINKQSPAIRNASKKQIPVKELGSPFRGVSQIPSVTFQSKLKPVDKLSFLAKSSTVGLSGSIPSLSHNTPKLAASSIARPSLKPSMLKSSLSTKALSSTNLALGGGLNQFGSPVKTVSYIPNLKSVSVASPLATGAGTNAGVGCSPAKATTSPVKKVTSTLNLTVGTGTVASTATSAPVIIAEDSKLPIQAEFDWYNLDAEYGKSNQPDVIVEADPSTHGDEADGTGGEEQMEEEEDGAESPSKKKPSQPEAVNGGSTGECDRSSSNAPPTTNTENGTGSVCGEEEEEEEEEELENVEYNLDEEYKSLGPLVPPPDIIIQKSVHPPITPPKNGKIPYNSLSFKELMQLNETPKMHGPEAKAAKVAKTGGGGGGGSLAGPENGPSGRNYEHFLDDSGLCSKPIILPRKKRVYYSGPFV